MRRLLIILMLVLMPVTGGPSYVSGQGPASLTTWPEQGKAVGIVFSDQPGKWWVFGPNFMPVEFRVVQLPSKPDGTPGGSMCTIHAVPGTYGAIFIPPGDEQPSGTQIVLGGGDIPPPPPPPPPPPSGPYQVMMFFTADRLDNYTSGQRSVLNSLTLRKWLADENHVLLGVVDPSTIEGAVAPKWEPFVNNVKGKDLPWVVIAPVKGGDVAGYPLPDGWEEFKLFLKDPKAYQARLDYLNRVRVGEEVPQ